MEDRGSTRDMAVEAGQGQSIDLPCRNGDVLRLVAVDTQGSYTDKNEGAVVVSIELLQGQNVPSLSACSQFTASPRTVSAGTIIMGDVIVNGVELFDSSPQEALYGYPEGTIVFVEGKAEIVAPFNGGCYIGEEASLESLAQEQLAIGCYDPGLATATPNYRGGCASIKTVIVNADGSFGIRYLNSEGWHDE